MDVAYIVSEINELEHQLELATNSDPLANQRETYINKVVSGIQALPGVNTREAVLSALDS